MESYSSIHQLCVQVFEVVSKTTTIFVLPVFMLRIVFANLLAEGAKVFTFLKGVIIYFSLILAFPLIIEILFSIPETYLPQMNPVGVITQEAPQEMGSHLIPYSVDRVLEVILALLYWVVYYVHIFFMIMMCSMAPIVFLSSTLLGFGLGIEVFMGLLLAGSSWPLIWYGFDQVHQNLASLQIDEFGVKCLELLITVLKGLSPVAFAAVAIKSPPGRVITGLTQQGVAASRWMYMKSTQSISASSKNNTSFSKSTSHTHERSQKSFKQTSKPKIIQERSTESKKKGDLKNENPRSRNV
ncbi:MAG: hypothetical protein LW875_03930 [Proteobacteria bacterium]|nr:hypothetical protein [Pseudomonadota bacterium]